MDYLHFYDAIAPIILGESIDHRIVFRASRYGYGEEGDYLNCPINKAGYERFLEALLSAEKVPLRDFEKGAYFEGCLPIEVMAERGEETLRFGHMKPVGLRDPRTEGGSCTPSSNSVKRTGMEPSITSWDLRLNSPIVNRSGCSASSRGSSTRSLYA